MSTYEVVYYTKESDERVTREDHMTHHRTFDTKEEAYAFASDCRDDGYSDVIINTCDEDGNVLEYQRAEFVTFTREKREMIAELYRSLHEEDES